VLYTERCFKEGIQEKALKELSDVEVLSVESDDEIPSDKAPSDKAPCCDAAIQTELFITAGIDVGVQTEESTILIVTTTDSAVQTDDVPNKDVVLPDVDNDEHICEGNNDDKFFPLVKKHKGIFMNAKGISWPNRQIHYWKIFV